MSFLYPWAFFLAGVLPVVVALYLQRPRRRKIEVSTLLFWQRLLEREPHRKFLGRLRHPLSLLLQLLIFLLLLLALVRPEFGHSLQKGSTVVVLDSRARMQAGNGAIFSEAVDEAGGILSTAGPFREIALLGAEDAPQIVSPFSPDVKELREKLASMSASDGGGSIGETISLARQLLASRPGDKRLIVVTDRPLADGKDIEQVLVGKSQDNIALLAIAQRPLPASPQSIEIFLKMGNFSALSREVELEVMLDDRMFDLRKFQMKGGEVKSFSSVVPAEVLRSGKGLLRARLSSPDALAVDNLARATLPVGQRLKVLQVGEDDIFLEQALKADPSLEVESIKPGSWKTEMAAKYDAVIFDNFHPEKEAFENSGSYFFFGRSPFEAPGEGMSGYLLEKSAEQNPLLWNVDTVGLRLRKAGKLQLSQNGWQVTPILEAAGEPVAVAMEGANRRRIVAMAFGVGDSNLPLRAGFPLLISNVVHWLAKNTAAEPSLPAGQTFIPAAGEKISKLPLDESKKVAFLGTEEPMKLRKNGFYEVQGRGAPWIAVNTADSTESDLRQSIYNRTAFLKTSRWSGMALWQWVAVVGLILLVLEWFLHHRRITE